MPKTGKLKKPSDYHSISLNKDAYNALVQLQYEIGQDLGFPPTYSQLVLHALTKMYPDHGYDFFSSTPKE
tara:strand:- start:316 stop:525 length:210 start_codon:yes stop_codon:yes gene_type:complete